MDYTQEQLDKMINDKVTEATKSLYTKDDLDKGISSEVDRRISTGIEKGISTERTKWEKDFSEKAKLSAEELAKKELAEQMSSLTDRESEVSKKANLLDAREKLTEAGVPKTHYDKFLGVMVTSDGDSTAKNINDFVEMYTTTKSELEASLKAEMSRVKPPKEGSAGTKTKEEFTTMTYSQKVAFKESNPAEYKSFTQ